MIVDNNAGGQKGWYTIGKELTAGGLSCMIASGVTNPLDVVKTRLQAQLKVLSSSSMAKSSTSPSSSPPPPSTTGIVTYDRFFSATSRIVREEGVLRGLVVPGMTAALLRETAYSSIRFGLYSRVKQLITGDSKDDPSIWQKMAAGMVTGAIGSAIANPTDLVKVRMQAEAGRLNPATGLYETGLRKGHAPTYASTLDAFVAIYREDGLFRGLYRGAAATSLRAALLTGGQLSSYETSKIYMKKHGIMAESFQLHVLCSVISSFVAATVCAPADLIKTRLLGDYTVFVGNEPIIPPNNNNNNTSKMSSSRPDDSSFSHRQQYRGIIDCFLKTVRKEGVRGLYRGWLPSWLRLAPHFIISMPIYEQLRVLFGLNHL